MRRGGGGIYGPKPRAKQIDEFIHHVAVEGAPDPVAAAQRLKALGPLSPAEKRRIEQGTRRQSGRTQAKVSSRLGSVVTPLTMAYAGQTAKETRKVVAKNLSRGNQGDPRRLSVEKQPLGVGMATWVPGGNPLRRAGSKVWNNGRLIEKAEEAAKPVKTAEQNLVESVSSRGAKKVRKQQEVLRSKERAVRAEALDKALLSQPGEAGRRAASEALAGEYSKLEYGALKNHKITADDVHRFEQRIRTHPELRPFEKWNTERSLHKVLNGGPPTAVDVRNIRRVFGDKVAASVEQHLPLHKRALESAVNVLNVPRAIKSAGDVSYFFRQGLMYFTAHPVRAARKAPGTVKNFREANYNKTQGGIYSRPNFERYEKGGLALTDTENMATRDEAFVGANLAERINVGVPGTPIKVGEMVKSSSQMYTGGLNEYRADWADLLIEKAKQAGFDVDNEKFLKNTMGMVNIFTGRGSLKNHEQLMKTLTLGFFSPRLILSRLQILFDPRLYVGRGWEGRIARQEARRSAAGLLTFGGAILFLAKEAGADVGIDPRSADFGRIRIGDTRIDIWGGLQAYVVAAYRILEGERMNSSTGEVSRVVDERDDDNFVQRGWNVTKDLAQQKYAPVPGYINAYRKGRTFEGDPFNPLKEGGKLFLPLGWENTYDTYRHGGAGPAAAGFGLGSVGFGANTYGASEPKKKGSSRGGGGGGIYGSRSRSGGGGGIYGR